MIGVLFVDDEPAVLDGLALRLRSMRSEWNMTFTSSAEQAMRCLSEGKYDVIVTDFHMPGTDGPTLLGMVRDAYPHIVRVVFSGHTDQTLLERALPVAHECLTKPTTTETLKAVVQRARTQQTLLKNEAMRGVVGRIERLPALPQTTMRISQAIDDPEASIRDVAQLIEQDMGLTAYLLKLVNSPYFAPTKPLESARDAVAYLGLEHVKSLVLSVQLFDSFKQTSGDVRALLELQQHSLQVAELAGSLMESRKALQGTLAAAMLHDVGLMVFATSFRDLDREIVAYGRQHRVSRFHAELAVCGFTHAELGAHLLSLWGLPQSLIETVLYHHEPRRSGRPLFDVLGAIHVADALHEDHSCKCRSGFSIQDDFGSLDWTYLRAASADTRVRALALSFSEEQHVAISQ